MLWIDLAGHLEGIILMNDKIIVASPMLESPISKPPGERFKYVRAANIKLTEMTNYVR